MNIQFERLSKNKWFRTGVIIFLVTIGLILIEATGVWLIRKHWSLMYIFNAGLVYVWCRALLIVSGCVYFSIIVHETRRRNRENYHVNQVLFYASFFVLQLCGLFVGAVIGSGLATLGQGVFGIVSVEKRINSAQSWNNIKERLYKDSNICDQLQQKFGDDSQDVFFTRRLDNIQSGCCKPPKECNFIYSSPIVWMKKENESHSNKDCDRWDNDPKKLCYNCQVCKQGYTRELKKAWTISGAIVFIASVMLTLGLVLTDRELGRS